MSGGSALPKLLLVAVCVKVAVPTSDGDAVFIREFPLSRLPEETQADAHRQEDASSRTARSEEDGDPRWDSWGSWSDCSRTCGGGASYSLRRCLSSKSCEGQNRKYRTCGTVDCPPEAGDFRAQQCSAHADVRFQGRYHEWLPVYNDPENPCALRCWAKASGLVLELAPKVLDGTRCYTESLDMCISGVCQVVGCDHELGSTAQEDNCGVCGGDGTTCRLVRGQYRSQQSAGRSEDTVVVVPYQSRHVRLVLKGPDHLYVESQTLQGVLAQLDPERSGLHQLENTTLDFQKLSNQEVLRMGGPLGADFTVKVRLVGGADSTVQYLFYQPIVHRWRETDFFPCSVTCGGGYQLTSAECLDLRRGGVVVDQFCQYYPENVKPKPRLQECNPDPCLASDGYKQITPYDLYHPLPRWDGGPWTTCSASCGGGVQSRSVSCVEEDVQGTATPTDEWKCLYSPKMAALQACNAFACPGWRAQDWSPCTVSCGQGLRYRVVLCLDHRGQHAGGCDPAAKPQVKEACLGAVPCYKPPNPLPVEAKPAWHKQAVQLEEEEQEEQQEEEEQEVVVVSEEPTLVPGPWQPCSSTCGAGTQRRRLSCRVLLRFSRTVADLPPQECRGARPAASRPCRGPPCQEGAELHAWEHAGFSECSRSCGGGTQEAVLVCLNQRTREAVDQGLCVSPRPPQLLQACGAQPCPPRWVSGEWTSCSSPCGGGLRTRSMDCVQQPDRDGEPSRVLRDQDCRSQKPRPVQACNRFDCAPQWEPGPWGQCSRSCGGGVQTRPVVCRQRIADGSNPELPASSCPAPSPPSQRGCGQQACPAHWVPAGWSQCSVTCGGGVQKLQSTCGQQGSKVDPENCFRIPQPTVTRPCSLGTCGNGPQSEVAILAQEQVYVQWRKARKLELVVGGHAYLLPWTTLLLRCPTRHFQKGGVQWLKDGRPVAGVPQASVSALGHLKVQQVRDSHAGTYTCVAGPARQNFTLQVIGSKKKLLPLERHLVEQLLQLRSSLEEDQQDRQDQQDQGSGLSSLLVLADPSRLDQVLSDGALGGRQLLQLLTAPRGGANQSTLAPLPDRAKIKAQTSKPSSGPGGKGRSCDLAGGNGTSRCSEGENSSQSAEPCPGQRCPQRWRAEPWSPCSASCGGGAQTRTVRCLRASEGGRGEGGANACLAAGRKPASSRPCNQQPCAGWSATRWGPCQGPCVGPGRATRHRHLYCQLASGAKASERTCSGLPRPAVLQNCSSRACDLEWHVGAWSPCTTTCGRHGFQSRQVTCAQAVTGAAAREHQCAWRPRPPSWQRCNLQPCGGAGDCQDSSRFCLKVVRLQLCSLPQFHHRCCQSCRNT